MTANKASTFCTRQVKQEINEYGRMVNTKHKAEELYINIPDRFINTLMITRVKIYSTTCP